MAAAAAAAIAAADVLVLGLAVAAARDMTCVFSPLYLNDELET